MSHPIAATRTYLTIYAMLIGLLLATVGVAHLNLGYGNLPAALVIAGVKGGLILWFFMHIRDAHRITRIFATAAFLWLAILLALTMMDFLTRGWLDILGK